MKNPHPIKLASSHLQAAPKMKIAALICAFYTVIWQMKLFPTDIYIFMMIPTIIGLISFQFDKDHENLSHSIRGIMLGGLSGVLVLAMPNYHILGLFCHFSLLQFGVRDLKLNKSPLLILTNLGSWILCFFFYSKTHDLEKKPLIFADVTFTIQLFVSILVSYCITAMSIFDRKIEIETREQYESKLLSLNQDLEAMNDKLQSTNKQLQEALEEKENFVLRFSHEIRNPLNSLLGNVELCYECAQRAELKTMLKEAKISGEILLQLLNNVLDTAKISTGKLDLSVRSQSIREFLERAWVVTSEIIRKKGLYGCLSVNIKVPEILDFDNHRVMQVLINTISNATKFTEYGFVKVFVDFEEGTQIRPEDMKPKHTNIHEEDNGEDMKLSNGNLWMEDISENPREKYDCLTVKKKQFTIHHEKSPRYQPDLIHPASVEKDINSGSLERETSQKNEQKNGFLRFEIIDSGCGIKKADLASLFTKFNQVSNETSKRQIGTGLGLWITKEIIELMEGKIEMFSSVNRGTTLVIMLKSRSSALPKAEIKLESPTKTMPSTCVSSQKDPSKAKRVLMVEDIIYNQEINRRFLEKCGIEEITVASNGKEALDLIVSKKEGFFDLILMDIDMPVMDGKEATKLIRFHEQTHKWNPTPIVFLTAYSEPKMQKDLLDANGPYKANGFLSKPVSQEIIKRTLSEQARNVSKLSTPFKKQEEARKIALIVDDDSFNLAMMARMIKICGYEPLQAQNGAAAVQLNEKHWSDIDVIFMDCEMPVMDGWEATKAILLSQEKRSGEKAITKLKSPPIYGLTGHVGGEYKQKCLRVGMKDVIEKPITIERLKNLLCEKLA